MIIPNTIEDLLIDFDEMGFAPTTLCPDTDEYAKAWKKSLIKAIEDESKETAKEILSEILYFADRSLKIYGCIEEVDFEVLCNEIAQRYGVEVDE